VSLSTLAASCTAAKNDAPIRPSIIGDSSAGLESLLSAKRVNSVNEEHHCATANQERNNHGHSRLSCGSLAKQQLARGIVPNEIENELHGVSPVLVNVNTLCHFVSG
jgi:hypothetical protein